MAQSIQLQISAWNFTYTDQLTGVSVQSAVPATAIMLSVTADCTSGNLQITAVQPVGGDQLLPAGTIEQKGNLPVPSVRTINQSYGTAAQVTMDTFACYIDIQQGWFWIPGDQPVQGQAIPRFGFRARSVISYSARTQIFVQQWMGTPGNEYWGPIAAQAGGAVDQVSQMQLGGWSDMQQPGATLAPCAMKIAVPTGTPIESWLWGPVKRYPLAPTAGTPAPVLV